MRALFEAIPREVERFAAQRRDLALVVRAGPREYVALCKGIEQLDQGASPDVFVVLAHAYQDAEDYAQRALSVLEHWHATWSQASGALTASERPASVPAPTPIPPQLYVSQDSPAERLRALSCFARDLVRQTLEANVVVALLPERIDQPERYSELVRALLAGPGTTDWCHHMRFVVREDVAQPVSCVEPPMRGIGVRCFAPDLGDAAIEGALADDANDEEAPLGQRMQSLLVLAGMDAAHRRTEQALAKYELLAMYHAARGDLPALALSLNGMGEACALASRAHDARTHFERALTPAVEAKDLPTLTNITYNLARLHSGQAEWRQACEYYAALSTLARASLNAALQVICHDEHGSCLLAAGQRDAALEQWRTGLTLAEGVNMQEHQLVLRRRLQAALAQQGSPREREENQQQIEALRRRGVQELPL